MTSRFDDWEDLVDCNKCRLYYTELCDGAKVGHKKKCRSFVATRGVNIPVRLDMLERRLDRQLGMNVVALTVVTVLLALVLYWRFS